MSSNINSPSILNRLYRIIVIILTLVGFSLLYFNWIEQKNNQTERILTQYHDASIGIFFRVYEEVLLLEKELFMDPNEEFNAHKSKAIFEKFSPALYSINLNIQAAIKLQANFEDPEFTLLTNKLHQNWKLFQAKYQVTPNTNLVYAKEEIRSDLYFLSTKISQLRRLHIIVKNNLKVKAKQSLIKDKRLFYSIIFLLITLGAFMIHRLILDIKAIVLKEKLSKDSAIASKVEAEEANMAKSVFLSNMSHEIRTPLNAINGYSQILLRNDTLDEDTREAIKTMDRSGKNLLNLINDILDISKIEAGKSELSCANFNLSGLIANLKSLFELRCDQKGLDWEVNELSGPTWVYGDMVKLQQILTNLISNAVKFTESGRVSLSVSSHDNNQFHFSITDTGPGIDASHHEKIFEPFGQETTSFKRGGTGLGLSISKKLVELMGSELLLESRPGEGSNFHFIVVLPRGEELEFPANTPTLKVLCLAEGQEVRALVVDDVKDNRGVVSGLLSDIGVTVYEAENGKEGVELARRLLPNIIFMDIRMPLMNGEQATKLIRNEFGRDKIKIVAITASALDHKREYYLNMGFDDYISKPFREESIYQCLGNLLNVEFMHDDEEISPSISQQISSLDFSRLSLTEELHGKL